MKTANNYSELPLTNGVPSVNGGHSTEFFVAPKKRRAARALPNRLLSLILVMAAVFVWTCWNLVHFAQTQSSKFLLIGMGSLAVCLTALVVAAYAAVWSRRASTENAKVVAVNERLVKERDLMRLVIDHLPDYIYAKDKQGRFILNNPAHAKDLGAASPEEMKGKSDFDFFPQELAAQFFSDEQKIIETGQPVINQEQYKSNPGDATSPKRWSVSSKVLWRDDHGNILGTAGITRDIHEMKLAQEALHQSEEKLREFSAQLERSNRELQDFAYVASHDLQEPLRKIVVFGERLKEKCGESLAPESCDYLERMQKAAARMQTLINDLLTFSRVTSKARPFAPINLGEIAREVVNDLEGRIEQVKGRVELGKLPVIEAEELQMRQLLQNLIGNALKFRKPEGTPVVKVEAQMIWYPAPQAEPGAPAQELCRLTVSDNGIGFDEKYLDRIFNVFQRLHTRNEYEGTGMGLAIARKIVLYHGGEITAKSKPGEGTTFIITLPVTHPKKQEAYNLIDKL